METYLFGPYANLLYNTINKMLPNKRLPVMSQMWGKEVRRRRMCAKRRVLCSGGVTPPVSIRFLGFD